MLMKTSPRQHSSISRVRASRLYKLLRILEVEPGSRRVLLKKLRVGMRTFYRDLDILRQWGIKVELSGSKYELVVEGTPWLELLPFPDPELSFAEAMSLAAAKSAGGRKLQSVLSALGLG
jgi:predicted DNA-binding transcriptional regulator YafY